MHQKNEESDEMLQELETGKNKEKRLQKDYSKKKADFRSLCECKEKRIKQEEEEEIRRA